MTKRPDSPPPSKASLKAWWKQFTTAQKFPKKDWDGRGAGYTEKSCVFNVPLRESLQYASVQISTANANGGLYVWGYIPVVVAKCGLFLKENATETPGTFRVSGSTKRMRDLQALFEKPPRYGKSLDLKEAQFTTHDVASVFRRYLTSMPEPVIPHDLYHDFRRVLSKVPFGQDECIQSYKRLIWSMPRANQYLLLYVLDLLSVFARKSNANLMTATNLAVIFRPGILSHPDHELSPDQHRLSQDVLEFLIAHQDWFMLDIPPPSVDSLSGISTAVEVGRQERPDGEDDISIMIVNSSDEEESGWSFVDRRGRKEQDTRGQDKRRRRRRTASASEWPSNPSSPLTPASPVDQKSVTDRGSGIVEGPMESQGVAASVTRSRTLPTRRGGGEESNRTESGRQRNLLKRGRGGRGIQLGRRVSKENVVQPVKENSR